MTTVTLSSLAAALENYAALMPKSVVATVLAAIDATTFQLLVKDSTIVVKSDVPLTIGASVELAVDSNGQTPTYTLVAKTADPQRALPQNVPATTAAIDRPAQPPVESNAVSASKALIQSAATVLRGSAAQQGGLAPLFADVESLLAQPTPAIPPAVASAARQLHSFRVDTRGSDGVATADLKNAIAQADLPAGAPASNARLGGMTGALLLLRQELKKWIDQAEAQLPESAPETIASESLPPPSRAPNLTPPYRNAPTVGQAPLPPSITGDEPPHVLAAHLLSETEAALARQTLLKIASLPEGATENSDQPGADKTSRMVDVPLILPQGTAVAQIRIEQDQHSAKDKSSSEKQPMWKASFSVDVESIGPVHVQIALMGDRTTVKMNAERPETAGLLSSGLSELAARLRDAQLEPANLHCDTLARKRGPAAPGLFTDMST